MNLHALRIFIGYFLAIGLVLGAVMIDTPLIAFYDQPAFLMVVGGSIILLALIFMGSKVSHFTWLGSPATTIFTFVGVTSVLIGIIKVLLYLRDPQSLGPSMALSLLSMFYVLNLMAFVSLPLEDWHNIKRNRYNEVSLSRISWFAFPVSSIFFTFIAMLLLLHALGMIGKA